MMKSLDKTSGSCFVYPVRSLTLIAAMFGQLMIGRAESASLERLDKRVDKLESDIAVARKSFLANMQTWRNSLKNDRIAPDAKRDLLAVVDAAIESFDRSNSLPDHPSLVKFSYLYAQSTQPIMLEVERLRQDIVADELRTEDDWEKSKIRQLERRVAAVAKGSVPFTKGAAWHGRRIYADGSAQGIHIHIDKVSGSQFSGRLRQTYQNGTSDVMEIAGNRIGNDVNFQTIGMKLGKGRNLKFDGFVIGSRIFAKVFGTAASGKPASGFIAASN